ncbi:MAG TPA: 4Fe-4S binding protein [Myxococcota bacterium]|nr:4Fe-4S binding protein [Myxococcota bacterium]
MKIAVASGKGGTGKTSLTAALVRLAGRCVAVDADVDAANLALLLPGYNGEWRTFRAGRRATIDPASCTACMACLDECPFHAIRLSDSFLPVVDPLACEGCGVCHLMCSAGAIRFDEHEAGAWTVRRTAWGPLVHAALGVGEDNSGKLVAEIRKEATRIGSEEGIDVVLIVGPPGIGCPVHAAVGGADLVVAVTEPGVAAAHDLTRLLDLAKWFHIPASIVLNKADLHPSAASDLRAMAAARGVPVLASLPFLPAVPRALARGQGLLDVDALQPLLAACWADIRQMLAGVPADVDRHGNP